MKTLIKLISFLIPYSKCRKNFRLFCEEKLSCRKISIKKYKKLIAGAIFNYDDLKVVHAHARFFNFGDNALAYGVKNIFLKYFDNKIRFINEDVHTTVFDKQKLEEINKKADILLVGGGGLIHTFDNEFWLFNMLNKDINVLKKPLILYGIGYNNFKDKPLHKEAIANIKKVKNKAVSFSVRNDGSKERLLEYDLNFDEVPDPGFFVDGPHLRPNIEGEYVMLQIAYDSPESRNTDNDRFFFNMVNLCKYLTEKNYTVVLSPHCHSDIGISNKVVNEVNHKKCFSWDWHEIMREDSVSVGLGYYKHASFVIAMRGHAQICPIGMNVPVISVINHPKHLGLLQKYKLDDMAVLVDDDNFDEKIKNAITSLINNKEEIKNIYIYI